MALLAKGQKDGITRKKKIEIGKIWRRIIDDSFEWKWENFKFLFGHSFLFFFFLNGEICPENQHFKKENKEKVGVSSYEACSNNNKNPHNTLNINPKKENTKKTFANIVAMVSILHHKKKNEKTKINHLLSK